MKALIRVAVAVVGLTFGAAYAATPTTHAPIQQDKPSSMLACS
jgi:hypothetical protein